MGEHAQAPVGDLEDSFAKLLERQPTDKERQRLYRMKDALGLKRNDALWLILMALQTYETRYERFPEEIERAARVTLDNFRGAAEAAAAAATAAAHKELATAVARASQDVARDVVVTDRIQWTAVAFAVSCALIAGLSWHMHTIGQEAGWRLGYGGGYQRAWDEKAANSWAATPEGKAGFALGKVGSLRYLADCSRPGWKIEGDYCRPRVAPDGSMYGWRVR